MTEGEKRIQWAAQFMPVLSKIQEEYKKSKPFKGIRVGMALHVEPKTAYLVRTLEAGGAKVAITGCNPLSTQDDTVDALAAKGTRVYAKYGQTGREYYESLNHVLDSKPSLVIDDGMDLIHMLHTSRKELLDGIRGGCEETTTGIHRLGAMARDGVLKFPVMDVNDARSKHLFDNYYGTGESVMSAIMATTNTMVSGKNFVVAGYGYCGSGLAKKASGLGASVIVTEVDPVRALKARMDGFRVMPMKSAVKLADFIVTTTGMKGIVTAEHFKAMKDKCILANAGHFNVEIDLEALSKMSKARKLNVDTTEYTIGKKKLYVLAGGRLVNLAASKGLGHPIEVMDMSFALQAYGAKYLLENTLAPGVIPIPKPIDDRVAELKLKSMGLSHDRLSGEQKKYAASWNTGT